MVDLFFFNLIEFALKLRSNGDLTPEYIFVFVAITNTGTVALAYKTSIG